MTIQVLMPALSPTMKEGTLSKWHVKKGDTVNPGDVIAEIETDKATMEVEAVEEGVVGQILIDEGQENVAVNTPIAVLLEEGEDENALSSVQVAQPKVEEKAAVVEKQKEVKEESIVQKEVASSTQSSVAAFPQNVAQSQGERIFASPLARRIASQENVDLSLLKGRGPRGRIVKADVLEAVQSGQTVSGNAAVDRLSRPLDSHEPAFEEVKNSSMRKVIAKRLLEAKQTIPHFYLNMETKLDALLNLRKDINSRLEKDGKKISVNDMVIKACALGLKQVPEANVSWQEQAMIVYKDIHVAVAVAIDGGLVTPVIRHADKKSLVEISDEMKQLAEKARSGKLMPEEYQGGTFSISNLGMFGIKSFSAVINPPQSCILAVGAGVKQPVVEGDEIKIASVMTSTLSVDHRSVDGAVGAEFLQAYKSLIEDPLGLLL